MVGVCLSFVKGFQLWETPLTPVNGMLSSTGNVQSLLCVLSCLSASVIVWTRFLVFFIFACLSRAFWRQHDFKVCSFQSLEAPCKRYKTVNRFEDKLSPGNCLIRSFWLFIIWIWCTSFAIFSFTRFQHMLRETEAICTTLPEELEVFDEDSFEEEVAIFYLGSQSTR